MKNIDQLYADFASLNKIPGYSFGIVQEGKLVHTGSGGFSDIQKRVPATCRSMFRIASMTKSFIAMAILKLRDEGKLRLDDAVKDYVPEVGQLNLPNLKT